jgi:hypothetical protein
VGVCDAHVCVCRVPTRTLALSQGGVQGRAQEGHSREEGVVGSARE